MTPSSRSDLQLFLCCFLGALLVVSPTIALADLRLLHTTNSAGRAGAVYVPSSATDAPAPLLVVFHGTGGSGRQIIESFRKLADEKGFLIVAPDSRRSPSGELTWQVGVAPGDVTEDLTHAQKCVTEALAMPDVKVDPAHQIAVGYSGGGSLAPYLATNDSRYGAFAVLHGGIFAGGLGSRRPRPWFSTGSADSERPPSQVQADADSAASRIGPVTVREFPGGHELSSSELEQMIAWWLEAR